MMQVRDVRCEAAAGSCGGQGGMQSRSTRQRLPSSAQAQRACTEINNCMGILAACTGACPKQSAHSARPSLSFPGPAGHSDPPLSRPWCKIQHALHAPNLQHSPHLGKPGYSPWHTPWRTPCSTSYDAPLEAPPRTLPHLL